MRQALIGALFAVTLSGCVDPKVPLYQTGTPTSPSSAPPSPSPNPTPPTSPPALTVSLAVGPSNPIAGTQAAFIANVNPPPTAPVSYGWSFGDGVSRATATEATFYTYPNSGVYDASVTVRDAIGRSTTATAHVTVQAPPQIPAPPPTPPPPTPTLSASLTCEPVAHGSPTPCNVTVSYGGATLPGSRVTSVTWDWGDGTAPTTTNTPPTAATSHVYGFAGTYTVYAQAIATTVDGPKLAETSKTIIVP